MLAFLRNRMKVIMIVVAVVFAVSMLYGLGYVGMKGGAAPGPDQQRIAKVNGQWVNPMRFGQLLSRYLANVPGIPDLGTISFFQNLALNQAVDFELVLADAKRNVRVGGADLRKTIDEIMAQSGVKERAQFERLLTQQGVTWGQFEDFIRDELLVEKRVQQLESKITVTPEDLREVRVRHILIRTSPTLEGQAKSKDEETAKTKIDEIRQKAVTGSDFAALAKAGSQDPGSAVQGGDLGFFGKGQMVAEFEKTAYELKPGAISPVVKTQFGYHILKLEETRLKPPSEKGGDVKKEILARKKNDTLSKWRADLRQNAKVEPVDPVLIAMDQRNKGQVAEALKTLQDASKKSSPPPLTHLFLASLYKDLGQVDNAVATTEQAIKARPADLLVHYIAARFYADLSKDAKLLKTGALASQKPASYYREQAIEHFRAAAMLSGDNINVRQQMLNELKGLNASKEVREQEAAITQIKKRQALAKPKQ